MLAVQFLSTLADNAFLIVAIARVVELAEAKWRIPLLKIDFTLFYVVLAPVVGLVSDAFRKCRVMLMANGFKVIAMLLLLAGLDPLLAIAVAGWGSAVCAPAKYGLMTELLPSHDLVRANGFFESATICAVILCTVVGGVLISPWKPVVYWPESLVVVESGPTVLVAGMLVLSALNALVALMCVAVADSGARYGAHPIHSVAMTRRFWQENGQPCRDPLGGLSAGAHCGWRGGGRCCR